MSATVQNQQTRQQTPEHTPKDAAVNILARWPRPDAIAAARMMQAVNSPDCLLAVEFWRAVEREVMAAPEPEAGEAMPLDPSNIP